MESNALALVPGNEADAAQLPAQILTIQPESYVAAVYEPFQRDLEHALAIVAAGVSYDITTTTGMRKAIECRALFRGLRVDIEKTRKERKAPILEVGRLLDSTAKAIIEKVEPHEERFDADIKAEEKRKADEKEAAARLEAQRILCIQNRISEIHGAALKAAIELTTAAEVKEEMARLDALVIDVDTFAEFVEVANKARVLALANMDDILHKRQKDEAEAAEIAREREELRQLRAERAARKAAEEQAAAEAAAQQASADALAMHSAAVDTRQLSIVDQIFSSEVTIEPIALAAPAAPAAEPALVLAGEVRTVFITARIHSQEAAAWLYDLAGTGEVKYGISIEAIE